MQDSLGILHIIAEISSLTKNKMAFNNKGAARH